MTTTFVTGLDQADLAAHITSDIAAGFLDLTIYSVPPAVIGSNIDDLIPNLSLLQALRFSDVSAFPINTFESANFSDLRILTTSNLNSSSFKLTQMNALIELDLSNLTTISGTDHFAVAQINALKTINLPNLTSMAGAAGTFAGTQMNALTSINWPANLPDLPSFTFHGTQVPKLPGICLSKNTTFVNNTFLGITQGPSDMKALVGKTQSNLVYASDFYGYACTFLVFDAPVLSNFNVFNLYSYKKYNGSDATNLTITAVNENPLPATVGNISIQSNGTITMNGPGTETFTIRFSANGGLIGARTITVNSLPGILNAVYQGSLLNFSLILPPEVLTPLSSDIHTTFSDMCVFAQTQDCQNFLAGIVINDYSDLFCSDAVILQHPEIVVVSCSDNILHLDDDDGHFTFSITDYMSDAVIIMYSDSSCTVSKPMTLSDGGFSLQTSDSHFVWVIPCDSDVPYTFTNVFNHPLLAIDAQGDIVDIGMIDCMGACHNPTSDLLYVSRLKASTLKLDQYLATHYSDYTSKILDPCHVLYLGPITAGIVTVDIETCRLIFSNFSIPFSDINVCS